MSRTAQRVNVDFARFAGEVGSTLYFDRFLRTGTKSWPEWLRSRFPALSVWQGIPRLTTGLKTLAGADANSDVMLANRSAQLMKLASRLLFRPCQNVLVTDLNWPSYQTILESEQQRSGNRLTCVRLRKAILTERISEQEAIHHLVETYVRRRCDGLFLPLVNNLGIRLPIEKIVRAIEKRATIRFSVVDGAQGFCHVPIGLAAEFCDFFIAGCHKWLGAYHPMGVGFCGRPRSVSFIRSVKNRMIRTGELDDPLLKFSEELQHNTLTPFGETVSLSPLFTCQGAVHDALVRYTPIGESLAGQISDAAYLASQLEESDWQVLGPQSDFQSGIVLCGPNQRNGRARSADSVRQHFHEAGIDLTTYDGGVVRIALPKVGLNESERDRLVCSFRPMRSLV